MTSVKISVNFDTCASNGDCARACPEVFDLRDDGYLYVLQENPDESLRPSVTRAAENCPTGSITVE
jgi:ferredoxin